MMGSFGVKGIPNIVWFSEIKEHDLGLVGGKGLNLGIMYKVKLPVPPGFVVTAEAFKSFLESTGLNKKIFSRLENVDIQDTKTLQETSEEIQGLVLAAEMPSEVKSEIKEAYEHLNVDRDIAKNLGQIQGILGIVKVGRDQPYVAVRSSATAEDLPEASFAGQQATFLNIKGAESLSKAVQKCWASLYTARAIYYRTKNNFPHEKVLIAVVVQKMVNSDAAGVMFSVNPSTNNQEEIMVEAAFGLGEAVVGGEVTPDTYLVDKKTMKLKSKKIAKQSWGYFRDEGKGGSRKQNLTPEKGAKQKITDDEILKLAHYATAIEKHYGKPQDIEWAVEGIKMYIVQARAVTTLLKNKENAKKIGETSASMLVDGLAASPGVGIGKVRIIKDLTELNKIEKGDILVTRMTSPDYVVAMQKAAAVVTDEGGQTCHAAIVSREMGIPAVVGTEKATQMLKEGMVVTVDGTSGKVYEGEISLDGKVKEEVKEISEEKEESSDVVTGTKVYMNLGEPEKIDDYKGLPFDGIGLMRLEFIILSWIGKHPLFLIKNHQEQFYVDKLGEGIGKIASAVTPRPVIVRFSDFKTNEYKGLEGGAEFEPVEDNPMIGWRGVSRYVSQEFNEAFRLECRAIKVLREKGLTNVHVMLPFVRTVSEVGKCLEIMKEEGLQRNHDFRVWLMAEVPAIALIPEEFAKLDIDGASIGSNDLTQGVLCVDRDSAKLSRMGYFDERNAAVLEAMKRIIEGFKKQGKTVSICGQAPSVYPEITEFLVKQGITSVSVNPDVVAHTRKLVASIERKILLDKGAL